MTTEGDTDARYTTDAPEPETVTPTTLAHVIAEAVRDIAEGMPQHEHEWDILGVWKPPTGNRPRHPLLPPNLPITIALIRCLHCGYPQTIELDGDWDESLLVEGGRPMNPEYERLEP